MKGLYITSRNNNTYFYNDESGFIELYNNTTEKTQPPSEKNQAYEITFCQTSNVKDYLFGGYGFNRLILEVTQSCNLRCKYCYYNEHYPESRNHGSQFMTFDTAKKSIDFYMSLFSEIENKNLLRKPNMAFYGGEPLLNLDLIKKSVEYIKTNYPKYDFDLSITTNGVLLNKEVADYLVANDFNIVVSLDGDKENHDRNRVKPNGEGSFDDAFNGINYIKTTYPDFKRINVNSCYDYYTDFEKISDFIEKTNISIVNIVKVLDHESNYFDKFTEEDKKTFNEKYNKLENIFFEKIKNKQPLNNFEIAIFAYSYVYFLLHSVKYQPIREFLPYTVSCIPGEKLYITVDGTIHMCERINHHFPIGTIEEGLDYDKITEYINKINLFQESCSKCNISRLCNACFATTTKGDGFFINKSDCKRTEDGIKRLLTNYVSIMEDMPKEFAVMVEEYFSEINSTLKQFQC